MKGKLAVGAAATLVAAGFVVAPPAQADDTWSSIYIEHNGTHWGAADNYSTKEGAMEAAADECQSTGAAVCREIATGTGCVAAARNDSGWTGVARATRRAAEAAALAGRPGGHMVVTRC